jgi:hypothetical protein
MRFLVFLVALLGTGVGLGVAGTGFFFAVQINEINAILKAEVVQSDSNLPITITTRPSADTIMNV